MPLWPGTVGEQAWTARLTAAAAGAGAGAGGDLGEVDSTPTLSCLSYLASKAGTSSIAQRIAKLSLQHPLAE